MRHMFATRSLLFPLFFSAGALFAQHGYTAADVESGGRLYRTNCSSCHGVDGTGTGNNTNTNVTTPTTAMFMPIIASTALLLPWVAVPLIWAVCSPPCS